MSTTLPAPNSDRPQTSLGGEQATLCEDNLNIALEKSRAIDRLVDNISEWFSAILVKEARQALKGRNFVWTFFLMLIIVVSWAIFSIAITFGENGNPGELGPLMLCGFLDILGFPLAIIVPYSTFRSLAREYENKTMQMVAVTTMKPYQIVAGKLGSAVLQIMMFVAVLAPCMSFTYLLRGIDLMQIIFGLFTCVFGSICLCCICLFLACGTRRRAFGIGMTVLLVPALAIVFAIWTAFSAFLMFEPTGFVLVNEPGTQLVTWAFIGFAGSTALICFLAATALVAFDTENRATPIRLGILFQQVLFIGFTISVLGLGGPFIWDIFWGFSLVYGLYWLVIGSMLISSRPVISRRVRRSFPKSFLSESVLGLLMPGAGRAYLFSLTNLLAGAASFWVMASMGDYFLLAGGEAGSLMLSPADQHNLNMGLLINLAYPVLFLSATFLIIQFLRRYTQQVSAMMGLLISAFLVLLGYLVGTSLVYSLFPLGWMEYRAVQAFDWFATSGELNSTLTVSGFASGELLFGLLIAVISSVGLAVVCFWISCKDLGHQALDTPERVLRERLALKRKKSAEPEESIDDIFRDLDQANSPRAEAETESDDNSNSASE